MQINGRRISIVVCICGGIAMTLVFYLSDRIAGYANWSPISTFAVRCIAGLPVIFTSGFLATRKIPIESPQEANSEG